MKPDPNNRIALEAELRPLQGKEWEVTVAGPSRSSKIIQINGKSYLSTSNQRLYSLNALKESAPLWSGVQVYDNHQTDEQFIASFGGMRSPMNEWVGVITEPYWDEETNRIRGKLKVVDTRLSEKLKNAWEAGVLNAIGLSMNTLPDYTEDIFHEGQRYKVAGGFKQIISVDIVGNPAAGGGFDRLLASVEMERMTMDGENAQNSFVTTKDELGEFVLQAVTAALAAKAEEQEPDIDDLGDEEVVEALADVQKHKIDKNLAEAQKQLKQLQRAAESEQQKAALARTELTVERRLEKARLPEKFELAIRQQFAGRVVEAAEVDRAIEAQREAYASLDPSGRVQTGGIGSVQVGVEQNERFELALMNRIMGTTEFRALEANQDPTVKERLLESKAYKSWVNSGKPTLPTYNRLSTLLYEFLGFDPLLDNRALEAVTTSTLATAVKNTVNIMTANSYSQRELWFERIVRVEEVDTIDDATLARLYGIDTLDTVPEGTAYTEISLQDDEETATFVKRGNYIGVTLETLMRDKINAIRRIPQLLADTWYNTQSDLVSNVFTANSHTGPVLGTTGALFNATATTSAGGHANLLTTALSHASFSAARTAMMKQTDQPLGVGRRLLIAPRFLLVPVDLESTANEIRVSELVPGADFDAAGGGAQTRNLFQNSFETLVVPQWTDATNWALVADPARYPAIWLLYPRGQRTPQIFSADSETSGAMFTNDELRFKVRLMTYRFSATYDTAPVSDFRPLHKSNVGG